MLGWNIEPRFNCHCMYDDFRVSCQWNCEVLGGFHQQRQSGLHRQVTGSLLPLPSRFPVLHPECKFDLLWLLNSPSITPAAFTSTNLSSTPVSYKNTHIRSIETARRRECWVCRSGKPSVFRWMITCFVCSSQLYLWTPLCSQRLRPPLSTPSSLLSPWQVARLASSFSSTISTLR